MQIYQDKDDLKLVQNIASASTLISSLTGIARDYIINKFPKGYFRSVYVDTEEASTSFYKNQKYNQNTNKVPYPSLSIGTEISLDSPISGMNKPREISATNLFLNNDLRRTYAHMLVDPSNRFKVYFSSDYITTNFTFKITVKKYIQNIDLAYYLKSRFQNDFFLYLNNQELSVELPKTFVKILSDIANLNLSSKEDMIKFQDFLASRSVTNGFVKKRVNLSTGNTCFFFTHNVNVLSYFSDLDAPPSIVRNTMNDDEYTVSFRLQLSTYLPNSFIMSVNKEYINIVQDRMKNPEENELDDGFASNPLGMEFNVKIGERTKEINFLNSSNEECVGLEVFSETYSYNLTRSNRQISLLKYLTEDLQEVYRFLNKDYLLKRESEFYITDVFQVRSITKGGEDSISIDYENALTISVNDGFFEDVFVSVYVDRTAVEAIKQSMKETNFFVRSDFLTPLLINIGGEELKVRVYSLSEEDLNRKSYKTALRIQTIYGTGYIGLVDPADKLASSYRICVGYDGETPIIKALELY